jgi:hypothetical protein
MSQGYEIDYKALIDRSIKDFQPVKKLWPVRLRLILWILLDIGILALVAVFRGSDNLGHLIHSPRELVGIATLVLTSIAAASMALRSAIPGREIARSELLLLIAVVFATSAISSITPSIGILTLREFFGAGATSTLRLLDLAALPWLALFWAVRRGVPLQPVATGALVGIAAFCFALAVQRFMLESSDVPNPIIWQAVSGVLITTASAYVGSNLLNWIYRWQTEGVAAETQLNTWRWFSSGALFPLTAGIAIAALIVVLEGPREDLAVVPDFDLAIAHYQRSLTAFRPNVPSDSIETVLNAYVEHGMPVYMWDFGPQGFRLVGGRWEPLPDGTPATYTWFRGAKGGVMCMIRQIDGFNPPSAQHEEHHHLLFYRYKGFSVCLINVGGYGNDLSVIVAPMPMSQFERVVLSAVS